MAVKGWARIREDDYSMREVRLLVTGKHGQVARCLEVRAAAHGISLAKVGRPEMDMNRPDAVHAALGAAINVFGPTMVINAAAFTSVDQAEDEPELAFTVNADSAAAVATAAADAGLPMVQISTDYVFDGTKDSAYEENDIPNPQSVYGSSKLAGEVAVVAANARHIILRTGWIYSPYGKNFVKTMIKLAETRHEVRVVADQIGNPTSAFVIAEGIIAAARRFAFDPSTVPWGRYHLVGNEHMSWARFAEEIFDRSAENGGPRPRVFRLLPTSTPLESIDPQIRG